MKKVAILQKYLSPYRIPLFNAISRHPGIDLTLIYYGRPERRRRWAESLKADKHFREYWARRIGFSPSYVSNYDFPYSLPRDLWRLSPQVVICAPDLGGLCTRGYIARTASKYFIWSEATPHTENHAGYGRTVFRRWVYEKASAFLVPGRLSKEYIQRFRPAARFYWANNSVDEGIFSVTAEQVAAKFQKTRKIITFSGSLIEDKGFHLLVRAFNRLLRRDPGLKERWTLRVLGAGPAQTAGYASDQVLFEGFCEGTKYGEYLKNSHVFILPSFHDCNPLTVIEALFAGNIIIVTDKVGSYPECIRENGMVIRSHSEEEIFAALQKVISLPQGLMTRMAQDSLELSCQFTTRRSAEGFIDAIQQAG